MKRYRTRKEKVLRRALVLLVLIAALSLTNAVNFLPQQAAWDIAEMQNMERPEILRNFYCDKLKIYRVARQILMGDEHMMILCAVAWDPLMGWYDSDWCTMPIRGKEPVYAGVRSHMQGEDCVLHVFGRVDDKRVAQVEFVYGATDAGESDAVLWKVPEEAYFFEDGTRYFLAETDALLEPENRGFYSMRVVSRDKDGNALSESDVWAQHWGTAE